MNHSLQHLDILEIDDGGRICFGADQEWYKRFNRRLSGCGPTNASLIVWYLSRTRKGASLLVERDASTKEGFFLLMENMWQYVTPGARGVDSTSKLRRGFIGYCASGGKEVSAYTVDIGSDMRSRPTIEQLSAFLSEHLSKDRPIAFLNLNNGREKNLDRWHWVTIVSFDNSTMTAEIYDQCKRVSVDIELWLSTTTLGGGFLAFEIDG